MGNRTRRTFLKLSGTSTIGITTTLAGCAGKSGGDGGGDGGSGGDGGGDTEPATSSPTQTATSDRPTVTHVSFPINIPWNEYLDRKGIYEKKLADAGYDFELKWSFDDPALFAAGQSQIAMFSVLEASRLGAQRGQSLTVAGKMMTVDYGLLVRSGSPYDPNKTGSRRATVNKLANDNAPIGIIGWNLGYIPAEQIIQQGLFNKDFSKNGDFNVKTAGAPALPKLLAQEKLDAIVGSPVQGAADEILAGDFVHLWWDSDEIAKQGWGLASLIDITVRDKFAKEHPEALRAFVDAYEEGVEWFYESGVEDIPGDKKYMKHYLTQDPKIAEYVVKWVQTREDVPAAYETDTPIVYRDAAMTDEWIARTEKYMNRAAELNQAPKNWRDFVTFWE